MISTTRNMALMFIALAVVSSGGMFALGQELGTTDAIPMQESGGIVGHVTVVVTDNDGNVKQYMQSDNAILDFGKDALLDDLFGTAVSAYADIAFTFIGFGGSNATAVAETDSPSAAFSAATEGTCPREDVTGGGNSRSVTQAAGAPVLNLQVVVDGSVGGCNTTFGRAVLANTLAVDTGDFFAVTKFSSDVTLSSTDTLTLDWDLTFN